MSEPGTIKRLRELGLAGFGPTSFTIVSYQATKTAPWWMFSYKFKQGDLLTIDQYSLLPDFAKKYFYPNVRIEYKRRHK